MLRYNGRSTTPNIEDLQEVIDQSDPSNIRYGNPNLKPSFNNNLRAFYNKYSPASMRSYAFNLFFSNTINSISNKTTYYAETGNQESRKVNVNGNWNGRAFFSFNTPLKNKKFTLSSNTNSSLSNSVSYLKVNQNNTGDGQQEDELSNTRNFRIGETFRGSYRNDVFDVTLNAAVTYNLIRNNKQTNGNRETMDYAFGGNTNINLPWQLYFSTDANYRIKDGYSDGFDNNQFIWNAQLSKNFLKNNVATIRLKVYDILQQQTNLSRSIDERRMVDTEYNTLGSYFMVHFVYRLNTLGGKSARSNNRMDRRPGGPGGPGGHGGRMSTRSVPGAFY